MEITINGKACTLRRDTAVIELKTYAGLIRNHKELAAELNVDVQGLSRVEREERLMIAAYEKWGTDMGNHINGQFGVALYDTERDELFCARDILGAELFFYYKTEEGKVLVSTDIKGLFDQPGFKRELNEELIQVYLGFSYLPGEETLFKGVYKLEPGGYLVAGPKGMGLGRYWELSFEPDDSKTLEEWADELSEAMDNSLADIKDPEEVCDSFLSGGVDSSYILAASGAKTGYCACYENQKASEEPEARKTAKVLGRKFVALTVTPEEYLANIDEFLLAFELPTADAAALSLYSACKQMVGKCSLCYSGEGADEFFGGYSVYRNTKRYRFNPDPVYFGTTYIMNGKEQARYLKKFYSNRNDRAWMKQRGAKGKQYDMLGWMLYTDLRSYFEGSILYNSTKIARGTGLDIRMPYCDLRIFDIARRTPSNFKVSDEGNKLTLRAAAARVLPEKIAYRKKLGFPVPVSAWLASPLFAKEFGRAFNSNAAKELFDVDELNNLLDTFLGAKPRMHRIWFSRRKGLLWRHVWTIYTFIRWYELFFGEAAEQ